MKAGMIKRNGVAIAAFIVVAAATVALELYAGHQLEYIAVLRCKRCFAPQPHGAGPASSARPAASAVRTSARTSAGERNLSGLLKISLRD